MLDPRWGPLTEDRLTRDLTIVQRARGHRFSSDDMATAYVACRRAPDARRILDLGCGIGSVLMMIAWRFPLAACTGVEAQQISAALARKSIAWNGAGERVRLIEGDFRDVALEPAFDLVTGTPPYFPDGTGTLSGKVQAGPCRFEHRGGVEAYCNARCV